MLYGEAFTLSDSKIFKIFIIYVMMKNCQTQTLGSGNGQ